MNSGEEEPPHWDGDLNLSLELESSLPQHGATIEDMEDEEDNYISVEPFQFSTEALAEEGLDALPWDPSEEILPREAENSNTCRTCQYSSSHGANSRVLAPSLPHFLLRLRADMLSA
ncbi:hypothetical protein C8R44DRAFT_754557 [Mycena epipterygia]|nr:hypothetical protein C8R44DRAFT_754557 [Mycena epipterygia]